MENLPYNNLEQLIQVLQSTYSGKENKQMHATEILTNMVQDPVAFMNAMISVVNADIPSDEAQKIKRAAIVHIPNLLALRDKITLEEKKHIMNAALEALFGNSITFDLKRLFEVVFQMFYGSDDEGDLRHQGLQVAKERLNTGHISDLFGALMIINSVITSSGLDQQTTSSWFIKLIEGLVNSGETLTDGVIQEIRESMNQEDQGNRISNIFDGLNVTKIWTDIIYHFTDRLGKSGSPTTFKSSYLELLVSQERILNILTKLLKLYLPTQKQGDSLLFSTSGIGLVDEILNYVKLRVLECFNKLLQYMHIHESIPTDPTRNRFYHFIENLGVKYVLDHLFRYLKNKDLDLEKALSEVSNLQECLVEALKFLSQLSMRKELGTFFFTYKGPIIMEVCLPLIKSTQQEVIEFSEDAEQFVTLALDCCEKQEQETPKTQAAQLLEHMSQYVDGVLNFVVTILLEIINCNMLLVDQQVTLENCSTTLASFAESNFVAKTESQIQVETCFLILADIAFLFPTRLDLVAEIEDMLSKHHTKFLEPSFLPIIQSRLCLFLGFALQHLFKDDDQIQMFELYLNFLVQCVGYTDEKFEAVAEQASHSLSLIFDPKKIHHKSRFALAITHILEEIMNFVKYVKSSQFFELLLQIIQIAEDDLADNGELALSFLGLLVERAEHEYLLISADPEAKDKSQNLFRVWNTIQTIIEMKDMILRYQLEIESHLKSFFVYMTKDAKFPFVDRILKYMGKVIKIRKQVTPLLWEVSELFPAIFERQNKELNSLFAPLNQLIIHGKFQIDHDPETLQMISDMLIMGLNPESKAAGPAAISECVLLLQLLIQYITIPNVLWENIIVACLEKLNTVKGFLIARLGGVILMAFLTNFSLTQMIIAHKNALENVIQLLLENVEEFESHPYDRKVFLVCFSCFFVQTDIREEVIKKLPQILSILVLVLKYVEMLEKSKAAATEGYSHSEETANKVFFRQFLKDDMNLIKALSDGAVHRTQMNLFADENDSNNMNILDLDQHANGIHEEHKDENDEDDYGDEDDMMLILSNADMANRVLDIFETEFKTQDEFKAFSSAMKQLKQENPGVLEQLLDTLPENKKRYMSEILYHQRVLFDDVGNPQSQARRIVKAGKRKTQVSEF